MTEKVRKLSILLQTLSRIPGLGFLADTERELRESVDQVDDMGDQFEDGKRQLNDVRKATGDLARPDDEN